METTAIITPHVLPGGATYPIVGHQFCSPVPLDLVFVPKSSESREYTATDASGKSFFRTEARVGIHEKRVLLDKYGNGILLLQAKALTLHETWVAYAGVEAKEERKLFTTKRSSMIQLKTGLNVFLAKSNLEQKKPDFRVEGKYMAREYTVYDCRGNKVLACGKRRWDAAQFLKDANTYDVHIEAGVDSAFIIALMLLVDELHHKNKKKETKERYSVES